jgi:hypothetical protein
MLAGGAGAIFGISMAIVSHRMGLNIALTGASLVILTSNCLCYCYITVLDKIITSVKTSFGNDKLICTKCGYKCETSGTIIEEVENVSIFRFKDSEKRVTSIMKLPSVRWLLFLVALFAIWFLLLYLGIIQRYMH